MTYGLVVVDMQRDLCRDARRRAKVDAAVPHIRCLIDSCHDAGVPIVYTYFSLTTDDPQFDRFGDRYCVEGTQGMEIIEELLPLRGPAIPKRKHSAFFETDLDDRLRAAGVHTVLFAGLQTQICILLSVADAYHRGYDPVVVTECVVSSSGDARLDALEWIKRYVGRMMSLEETLAAVAGSRPGDTAP